MGHISKREYLVDYEATQYELDKILTYNDNSETIERLASFLANIANAWKVATQEQRNKLARSLFDKIVIEDSRVVLVKPKPELEQFFKMNFKCHARDIAGDPEGGWNFYFPKIFMLVYTPFMRLLVSVHVTNFQLPFGQGLLSDMRRRASGN